MYLKTTQGKEVLSDTVRQRGTHDPAGDGNAGGGAEAWEWRTSWAGNTLSGSQSHGKPAQNDGSFGRMPPVPPRCQSALPDSLHTAVDETRVTGHLLHESE